MFHEELSLSGGLMTKLILLVFSLSLVSPLHAEQRRAPIKQTMALVRIWDASPPDPKYIFVIGNSQHYAGYKTVNSLKEAISRLPGGSTVEWFPSDLRQGDEPLSTPDERKDFGEFCKSKGIKLVVHMAG